MKARRKPPRTSCCSITGAHVATTIYPRHSRQPPHSGKNITTRGEAGIAADTPGRRPHHQSHAFRYAYKNIKASSHISRQSKKHINNITIASKFPLCISLVPAAPRHERPALHQLCPSRVAQLTVLPAADAHPLRVLQLKPGVHTPGHPHPNQSTPCGLHIARPIASAVVCKSASFCLHSSCDLLSNSYLCTIATNSMDLEELLPNTLKSKGLL
jgi:hypothetical protein